MGNCSSQEAASAAAPVQQPRQISEKQQDAPPSSVQQPPQSAQDDHEPTTEVKKKSRAETMHSQLEEAVQKSVVSKSGRSITKGTKVWVIGQTADIRTVYQFDKILGKGQFGTTRLARHRASGEEMACKSISKRKLTCKEDLEDVQREVQILYHLQGHSNVVKIKDVFEDTSYVHIVMELATGGELFDRIVERGFYTEKDASTSFRTMVEVISHCHNMGVMHRDIKPENFLLADTTPDACLKATDFGLSMFFKEGQKFREIVGSAYYVAPEVLKRSYSKEADIWSLGVMLYILLCGVPPFYGDTEAAIFQEVLTGNLDLESDPWPSISKEAKGLVTKLLVRDPTKRMSAMEVLDHPWVRADGVATNNRLQHEVVTRLQGFAAMNKLKKEALKIIAGFLPENEIKGLREMFQSIDVDGSGTITVAELRSALKAKGQLIPESDVQHLIMSTDINGDGTIDYEEFLAATIHQSKLEQEENLYKAFKVLDNDGSGFIDRSELVAALSKYGEVTDLDAILAQVDTDGDGRVDYEEFCTMMRNNVMAGAAVTAAATPPPLSGRVKDRADITICEGDKVVVAH